LAGPVLEVTHAGDANSRRRSGGDVLGRNLVVQGNIHATGSITPSSSRLKEHVTPMSDALEGLLKLEGVRFDWKADEAAREFREQLTPVGTSMPNLYVAEEISANKFKVADGKPGAKVTWQVTGIRHDQHAREHPIVPEVERNAIADRPWLWSRSRVELEGRRWLGAWCGGRSPRDLRTDSDE
jgi:hypothetical protein